MKKCLLLAVLLAAVLAGPGCKKKQPPPKPMPPASVPPQGAPAGMPGMSGMPGMPGAPHGEAAVEKQIVLPEDVRGAWKAVRLEVVYKEKKEKKEKKRYVVPLGSEFKVPDTGLTLKTGSYFPHFKMLPDRITSESNRQENPAVQLEVFEGGKEIFHGWLFAKFPDIHPFAHDKYAVILVEGIAK